MGQGGGREGGTSAAVGAVARRAFDVTEPTELLRLLIRMKFERGGRERFSENRG